MQTSCRQHDILCGIYTSETDRQSHLGGVMSLKGNGAYMLRSDTCDVTVACTHPFSVLIPHALL